MSGLEASEQNNIAEAPLTVPAAVAGNVAEAAPAASVVASAVPESRKRNASGSPKTKEVQSVQWDEMFGRLEAYKSKFGDCLVPKRYVEDPKLGTWVETQRCQMKRLMKANGIAELAQEDIGQQMNTLVPSTRLNSDRLQKLHAIGFAWAAPRKKPQATKVITKSSTLSAKIDATPTMFYSKPPASKQKYVSPKRQAQMEQTQWNQFYRKLAQYRKKYGDCMVPKQFELDNGMKLGLWVDAQRSIGNKDTRDQKKLASQPHPQQPFKPRLSHDRRAKLDAIDFIWSLRLKQIDDHWDHMFQQLAHYHAQHGDCLVPSRYGENKALGKWVETQRYQYTKLQRLEQQKQQPHQQHQTSSSSPDAKPPSQVPRLTEDRVQRLESLGFEWKVKHKMKRHYDKQWNDMFQKLLEYKRKNGNCLVPKRYVDDIKLGTWVHTQRIQYRRAMTAAVSSEYGADEEDNGTRLSDERRKRLEHIGFIWSARDHNPNPAPVLNYTPIATIGPFPDLASIPVFPHEPPPRPKPVTKITRNSYDDQWDDMFDKLKEYKEKHGDCLVPKRCKENQKLGTWVDTQRVQYKKLMRKLDGITDSSLVKKVDEAAFKVEDLQNIPALEQDRSKALAASGKPLVGRLTDERIKRLDDLGFVWVLRDDWQKHYTELVAYKKERGNCNVPARYSKNRRLGIWVSAQRQQYKLLREADGDKPRKSTPLTQKRIDLLNELGFTWTIRSRDSLGESWNQRLDELRAFKEANGNCLVPSRYPPNPELGVWVGTQRTQYRLYIKAKEDGSRASCAGTKAMNDVRIKQLEELGFVWTLRGSSDNVWARRMEELQLYILKYGSCNVPKVCNKFPRLASWVTFCRAQYRLFCEGKPSALSESKIAELNAIGFLWTIPGDSHVTAAAAEGTKTKNMSSQCAALPASLFLSRNVIPGETELAKSAVQDTSAGEIHAQNANGMEKNIAQANPPAIMEAKASAVTTNPSIGAESHGSKAAFGTAGVADYVPVGPPGAKTAEVPVTYAPEIAQAVNVGTTIMPDVGVETAAAIAAPGPVVVDPALVEHKIAADSGPVNAAQCATQTITMPGAEVLPKITNDAQEVTGVDQDLFCDHTQNMVDGKAVATAETTTSISTTPQVRADQLAVEKIDPTAQMMISTSETANETTHPGAMSGLNATAESMIASVAPCAGYGIVAEAESMHLPGKSQTGSLVDTSKSTGSNVVLDLDGKIQFASTAGGKATSDPGNESNIVGVVPESTLGIAGNQMSVPDSTSLVANTTSNATTIARDDLVNIKEEEAAASVAAVDPNIFPDSTAHDPEMT